MTSLTSAQSWALRNLKGKNRARSQKGFTLVELLVTVGILGTLSAIAIPGYLELRKEGAAQAKTTELVEEAKKCLGDVARSGAAVTTCGTNGVFTAAADASTTAATVTINPNGTLTIVESNKI